MSNNIKSFVTEDYIIEGQSSGPPLTLSRPINTKKHVNIPSDFEHDIRILVEDDVIKLDTFASQPFQPKPISSYETELLRILLPNDIQISHTHKGTIKTKSNRIEPIKGCIGIDIKQFNDTDDLIETHCLKNEHLLYTPAASRFSRKYGNCPTCNIRLARFKSFLLCTSCESVYNPDNLGNLLRKKFENEEIDLDNLEKSLNKTLKELDYNSDKLKQYANPVLTNNRAVIFELDDTLFYTPPSGHPILMQSNGLKKAPGEDPVDVQRCPVCLNSKDEYILFKGGTYQQQGKKGESVFPYCIDCAEEIQELYDELVTGNENKILSEII